MAGNGFRVKPVRPEPPARVGQGMTRNVKGLWTQYPNYLQTKPPVVGAGLFPGLQDMLGVTFGQRHDREIGIHMGT